MTSILGLLYDQHEASASEPQGSKNSQSVWAGVTAVSIVEGGPGPLLRDELVVRLGGVFEQVVAHTAKEVVEGLVDAVPVKRVLC